MGAQGRLTSYQTGRITSNGLQAPSASHRGPVQLSTSSSGQKSFQFVPFRRQAGGSAHTTPLSAPALGRPPRNGVALEPPPLFRYLCWMRHRLPHKQGRGVVQWHESQRNTIARKLSSGGFWTIRTGAGFYTNYPTADVSCRRYPLRLPPSGLKTWHLREKMQRWKRPVLWSLCDDGDESLRFLWTNNKNQVYKPVWCDCRLRVIIPGVPSSAGGWRRPEGVEKSAGVLTVSFRESPLHFPYLSGYRVEASDWTSSAVRQCSGSFIASWGFPNCRMPFELWPLKGHYFSCVASLIGPLLNLANVVPSRFYFRNVELDTRIPKLSILSSCSSVVTIYQYLNKTRNLLRIGYKVNSEKKKKKSSHVKFHPVLFQFALVFTVSFILK